jgi:hypothetical protein
MRLVAIRSNTCQGYDIMIDTIKYKLIGLSLSSLNRRIDEMEREYLAQTMERSRLAERAAVARYRPRSVRGADWYVLVGVVVMAGVAIAMVGL